MPSLEDKLRLRKDTHTDGRPLTQEEREDIVKPYLPPAQKAKNPPKFSADPSQDPILHAFSQTRRTTTERIQGGWQRPRIRQFLATCLHALIFNTVQILFSIFIHTRRVYHAVIFQCLHILFYHHRSPELIRKDVKDLTRLPNHLSFVVDILADDNDLGDGANWEGLERLVRDVCELSAWSVCAGIPMISIFERTGVLKQHMPYLSGAIRSHLKTYFPTATEPSFDIHAPHQASAQTPPSSQPSKSAAHLEILLISASDGRDTLVDLTKTLAEMSQRGKLSATDISTELIDGQVTEASFPEPDLLVIMAPSAYRNLRSVKKSTHRRSRPVDPGTSASKRSSLVFNGPGGEVCLRGYPPWQVRLTEIFHIQDSHGVEYQVFLRALCRYAKAQMRFGR